MIASVSYNQSALLNRIIKLHCPNGIECDPTYSTGMIYKSMKTDPKYKFDIEPKYEDVKKADCRELLFIDNSVESIMFDPPFVVGGNGGVIKERFGYYKTIQELWQMYTDSLKEFYRILREKGVLIFKCQDTIDSGKQYLSEYKIIKEALKIGFYPKDIFILVAKSRVLRKNQKTQKHARKYHSYFIVFIKCKPKVNYG